VKSYRFAVVKVKYSLGFLHPKGEVFVIVWRTPLPRVVISAVDLLCLRAAEYDAIADMSASINSGVGV